MLQIKTVVAICILLYISTLSRAESEDHLFDMHTTEDHHNEHSNNENIGRAIGITIFAGFASFIGAFSIFCIKKEYIGVLPASLAFSAGVTVHLTFMSLIPEAIALLGPEHDGHEEEQTGHNEHDSHEETE
eukprot:200577_1